MKALVKMISSNLLSGAALSCSIQTTGALISLVRDRGVYFSPSPDPPRLQAVHCVAARVSGFLLGVRALPFGPSVLCPSVLCPSVLCPSVLSSIRLLTLNSNS